MRGGGIRCAGTHPTMCPSCGTEGVTIRGTCRTCAGFGAVPSPTAPIGFALHSNVYWYYSPTLAVCRTAFDPLESDEWMMCEMGRDMRGITARVLLYARSTSPDLTPEARTAIEAVKRGERA